MTQVSQAKIFVADERGVTETEQFQRRHTFNFGKYFNEHKNAFGDIYLLNDDILAGGGGMQLPVEKPSVILLIPVAGAIRYKDSLGNSHLAVAGQAAILTAESGLIITISNPFRDQQVNFLQLWITANKTISANNSPVFTYNDVNENLNTLVAAAPGCDDNDPLPFRLYIGKFSGRGETVYTPRYAGSRVFIFVIQGAFEVAGRLLHARDGLALWQPAAVEMEALSNDAIILVMELPA